MLKVFGIKGWGAGSPQARLFAFSLICLLAYANSFQNHFMLDDNIILFGQRGVLNKSFLEIFTSSQGEFYRPIGHVPLWVFSRLWQGNYAAYHAANLLLFIFIVFLFFVIVRKITSDTALSFFSALLYAIHPLNALIVNYITASVIAVFVLSMEISFLFFICFSEHGRKKDYIFSLIFFVFALFSHEMAAMLPAYLITYLFFIKKESWGKIFRVLWPFILLLIGWAVFRLLSPFFPSQFNRPLFASENMASSFSTWMDLMIWYVSNLIFPHKVIFLWSSQYSQAHLLRNLMVFVLAFSGAAYALYSWKRSWKSFLLMVFILVCAPTIFSCFGNFPKAWPMIEPHWFYFTEIGYFVLLAWILLAMARRNFVLGTVFAACVILLLLINCWSYNMEWKNQEKYSLYWLSLNTGNLTPYDGLGRSLMDKGDYYGAAAAFSTGYKRLNYGTFQMVADWGHCLDMLGFDKVALYWLSQAAQRDSHYALTYQYLGLYFQKRGNFPEAQKAFKTAAGLARFNS